jgi:hypothetical protein
MSVELIAEKKILIPATPEKVWNVLVKPRFIRKWDELPEGFGNSTLDFETVLRWDHPDAQFTELTVTAIEPRSLRKVDPNLYVKEFPENNRQSCILILHLISIKAGLILLSREI